MWKLVDTRHGKTLGSYETPLATQKALDLLRKGNDRLIAVPEHYAWSYKKQVWTDYISAMLYDQEELDLSSYETI
ncbi:MAG: hypothetical protein KAR44_12520 [Candidatus Aegiribacteria sp.]|nr:hypothetical protein [Candidatus Aegiribacteria sp.]